MRTILLWSYGFNVDTNLNPKNSLAGTGVDNLKSSSKPHFQNKPKSEVI